MNILYICDEYPPGRHGGIGTVVQLLAREMVKLGHAVVVAGFYDWGYGGEDEFNDEGVSVFRFRRKLACSWFYNNDSLAKRGIMAILKRTGVLEWDVRSSLPEYNTFLNVLIRENNIDIVEMPDFHDYMLSCKGYVPSLTLSAPVVIKLHGSITYFNREAQLPVPEHVYRMEQEYVRAATAIAGVSKYTAEKTAMYFNYEQPITVMYNGIDTSVSVPAVTRKEGQVIYTGSLAEKKGIYQLMKAWNIVVGSVPGAELLVYGKGPIERLKSYLSGQAQASVFFKGHVPRKALFEAIATSSVAVFPSYAECFALGPMEAMACRTAVIYSLRTSGPELIENNENGLLIDPDDVNDIAEKIIHLLRNPDERSRIASQGRDTIMTRFDINRIAKDHLTYYQQVLQHKS